MDRIDVIKEAKRVFDIEINALEKTKEALDGEFEEILRAVISCTGKVIITGMGKPGHIGEKLAATFSSLGTPSFFLHPAEAMHGDLGMVAKDDVVIAISFSGESDEIVKILPTIKLIGAKLIGITGNANSTLAEASDIVQVLPDFEEACYLGLAPTSSTTVALCYGDALAVVASGVYGFKDADFGKFHPAGALGKKLIYRVNDLMDSAEKNAVISVDVSLKEAIIELSDKGLGLVSLVDGDGNLKGVITEGDLRRMLKNEANVYEMSAKEAMTSNPKTIDSGKLAYEALSIMRDKNISSLPVMQDGKVVGTIRMQAILGAGIV